MTMELKCVQIERQRDWKKFFIGNSTQRCVVGFGLGCCCEMLSWDCSFWKVLKSFVLALVYAVSCRLYNLIEEGRKEMKGRKNSIYSFPTFMFDFHLSKKLITEILSSELTRCLLFFVDCLNVWLVNACMQKDKFSVITNHLKPMRAIYSCNVTPWNVWKGESRNSGTENQMKTLKVIDRIYTHGKVGH